MVDGILTLGILWLDHCRQKGDGRRHFGGLKVIVPAGAWRTTAERMAWLNHAAADFQLFTLDERSEELDGGGLSRHRQPGLAAGSCFLGRCGHRALPGRCCPADGAGSGQPPGSGWRCGPARRARWGCTAWPGVCAGAARVCGQLLCARGRDHVWRGSQRDSADGRRTKRCAASCCARLVSRAGTPTGRTPTRCSACSRSAGWRRGCAPGLPNCCRGCAAICFTRRCRRSRPATAACWTC